MAKGHTADMESLIAAADTAGEEDIESVMKALQAKLAANRAEAKAAREKLGELRGKAPAKEKGPKAPPVPARTLEKVIEIQSQAPTMSAIQRLVASVRQRITVGQDPQEAVNDVMEFYSSIVLTIISQMTPESKTNAVIAEFLTANYPKSMEASERGKVSGYQSYKARAAATGEYSDHAAASEDESSEFDGGDN